MCMWYRGNEKFKDGSYQSTRVTCVVPGHGFGKPESVLVEITLSTTANVSSSESKGIHRWMFQVLTPVAVLIKTTCQHARHDLAPVSPARGMRVSGWTTQLEVLTCILASTIFASAWGMHAILVHMVEKGDLGTPFRNNMATPHC
jgi:hypothetical protein